MELENIIDIQRLRFYFIYFTILIKLKFSSRSRKWKIGWNHTKHYHRNAKILAIFIKRKIHSFVFVVIIKGIKIKNTPWKLPGKHYEKGLGLKK